MKCTQCGGNIDMEDERCPYCGVENPYFKKHRAEMFRFRQDYEKTKEEVLKNNSRFAGMSAKITVIAILLAVDILLIFLASNSWSLSYVLQKSKVNRQAAKHRAVLEQYEADRDYLSLSEYYSDNLLYSCDALDDFDTVQRVCNYYSDVYTYLVVLGQEDENDYMTVEKKIEYICSNLDYLYRALEPGEYDSPEEYQGSHKELLDQIEQDIKVMLITYANITEEEAERFPKLSSGRRIVAMERGLGLNED